MRPEERDRNLTGNDRGTPSRHIPPVLALFQKRIDGDDALLELASLRFAQAGLGAEFYAHGPDELDRLLHLAAPHWSAPVVHLDRGVSLLREGDRSLVLEFASRFAHRVHGFVVHDQREMASRMDELVSAAEMMASRLDKMRSAPYLFIEYAAGLDPNRFAELIHRLHSIERITACIDIGHVGIRETRAAFGRQHPERDVCALSARDPILPDLIADVQRSVETALPAVLQLTRSVGRIGKPVHFHMHDGHPLKAGIADHLSFLGMMPIPFEFRGRRSLANMFGVGGLAQIVSEVLAVCGSDRATFTLEIHPTEGRLALDDAASLFAHWRDTTNAERMNHWLSMLVENQQVLVTYLEAGLQGD